MQVGLVLPATCPPTCAAAMHFPCTPAGLENQDLLQLGCTTLLAPFCCHCRVEANESSLCILQTNLATVSRGSRST